jgi:general secretion pathway protein B
VSLILDALRRADAERERERHTVPGLHAQHAPAFMLETPLPAQRQPWLWPVVVATTGLAAALVAWLILGRQAPRETAAAVLAEQPLASAPAASAPLSAPDAAAVREAAAAAPASTAPPAEADTAEARPVAEPAPWPARSPARKAPPAEVASAPAARPAEPKAALPAEAPLARREQLPQDIRAQLPPLAVGGSIYSANAPDRSIIIDGRILRENDRIAADLALEQIRPKSAVLRFKGHRFEIAF